MIRRMPRTLIAAALCALAYSDLYAQATRPTAKPTHRVATRPAAKPLVVIVKEVKGAAQRLLPGAKSKWVALKVGDKLDELTVIRTGLGARVVLRFADNSEVVINRATKMGIAEFRKDGNVTKTRLGLKYGSIRAKVERARGPSDFRVTTPVATLAVAGTSGEVAYMGDFGFNLKGETGTWQARVGRKLRQVQELEGLDSTLALYVDMVKSKMLPKLGDMFGGLTGRERLSMRDNSGGRGAIGFLPAGNRARAIIRKKKLDENKGGSITPGPVGRSRRRRRGHQEPPAPTSGSGYDYSTGAE
ncbi:MAG: hypothetical protein B1H04_04740 [Planctomycetales bacterium 4484_123]|nr:MAG: hypothetical protein B1H04_04740 [Planctomycetales bacterium 4484_123]